MNGLAGTRSGELQSRRHESSSGPRNDGVPDADPRLMVGGVMGSAFGMLMGGFVAARSAHVGTRAVLRETLGDSYFDYNNNRYNGYSAYKSAIGSSNFIPSDTTNPRLLTDAQFAGF